MNGNRLLVLTLLSCATGVASSRALAEDPSDLEGLLQEHVVTSASKSAETANSAPATTVTVTSDQLRRYGLRTVADAVRFLVPGAFMEEVPRPSFGSRGVLLPYDLSSHVLVLVDGHVINSEVDGSGPLEVELGIPIEMVDHIEVMLEPGSVLYGSNAMFGVVHVVTKRVREFGGLHLGVDAEFSHQYRGFIGGGGEISIFGQKGELTLGLEATRMDDPLRLNPQDAGLDVYTGQPLRLRADGSAGGIWGGTWNHNDAHTTGAYARLRLGDFQLTTRAGTQRSNDPEAFFDFDNPNMGFSDKWLSVDASYQKRLSAPLLIKMRLYGDEVRNGIFWHSYAPQYCLPGQSSGCRMDNHAGAEWVGLETQATVDWLEDGSESTLLGVDARLRNVAYVADIIDEQTGANPGSVAFYSKADTVIGAYVQHVMQPIKHVTLNGGARLDAYGTDTAFSPRAALVYEPWDGGVIKAIYSSAFQAPLASSKAFALPLVVVPAGHLENERVRSVELALEQRLGTQLLRTSLFHSDWQDMVELVRLSSGELQSAKIQGQILAFAPQAFQYRNAASIQSSGLTTGIEGTLFTGSLRYGLSATETVTRRRDPQQGEQLALRNLKRDVLRSLDHHALVADVVGMQSDDI